MIGLRFLPLDSGDVCGPGTLDEPPRMPASVSKSRIYIKDEIKRVKCE